MGGVLGQGFCQRRLLMLFLLFLLIAVGSPVAAAYVPPPVDQYVAKDSCLRDFCRYGKQRVVESTRLFADKDIGSPVVTTLPPGTIVYQITSDVHSRPAKVLVTKPIIGESGHSYAEGEVFYVLMYSGHNRYKVWHRGEIFQERLIGVSGLIERQSGAVIRPAYTWAVALRPLEYTLWVKVRTMDGLEGWTNEPNNFGRHDSIDVILNGRLLNFQSRPLLEKGTVLVPLPPLIEALGGVSSWDPANGVTTIACQGVTVQMISGASTAVVDGRAVELPVPARDINGVLFVPVRFLVEIFGGRVEWDQELKDLTIKI